MRLHHLRLRAFGPFAGEECVDFDGLSQNGLFLMHGPTGAGKTSVLDAVCFALYGRVPGDRARVLGGLRSDHAPAGAAPEVACDVSVGARRFEVVRSPQWERPKRRGTGTVTEQARVRVVELTGGSRVVLTTRLDEAGDLVQQVLGLGVDQFTKLVLLPQGDFAAFLRSDAESRRRLLEKLFHTDRFAGVQKWLGERRVEVGRRVSLSRAETAALLARASQAVAPLDPSPGVVPVVPVGLSDLEAMAVETARIHNQAATERRRAAARLQAARDAYTEIAMIARDQGIHQALLRRAEHLASLEAGRRADEERVRAAEHARAIAPLVVGLTRARADLAAAELTLASIDPEPLGDDQLAAHVEHLTRTLGELDSVEEDAGHLVAHRRTLEDLDGLADQARAALRAVADRLRRTSDEREDVVRRLGDARLVASREADCRRAVEAARLLVSAVQHRDRLNRELVTAEARLAEARYARDTLRATWLDLREARLEGMAAELAVALVSGEPCRVCGSPKHPEPASSHVVAVTEADEALARSAVDDADATLAAATDRHAGLAARLAAARTRAGDHTPEQAAAAEAAAETAVDAVRAAQAEQSGLGTRLSQLESELARAADEERALRDQLELVVPELEGLRATVSSLAERVDRARGDHPTVADRRRAITAELARCAGIAAARAGLAEARARVEQSEPTTLAAAREAGFDDVASAAAAVLDDAKLRRLRETVADHDREKAGVQDRLADPDLARAAALPPAEVDAAAAEARVAEQADEAASHRLALAASAAGEITGILAALRRHLAEAEPLEAEHALVEGLCRCVDGTSPDNAQRMSLSSYVLAARLEQVAQAATEHLSRMSGGRFALVHSDAKERGGARSGLGLRVVDGWTGRRRETATLSGGETFYTSLALALGLADVVTRETGGLALETLFIDEGFGSLDEDTLDEVMDVLDDLRAGGRTVGLVSHVADLRTRLPQRLEVVKGRDGSTLRGTTS